MPSHIRMSPIRWSFPHCRYIEPDKERSTELSIQLEKCLNYLFNLLVVWGIPNWDNSYYHHQNSYSAIYISSPASSASSPSSPPSLSTFLSIFTLCQFILYIAIYHFTMYVHLFLHSFSLLPLKLLMWHRSDSAVVALALVLVLVAMLCAMVIIWRMVDTLIGLVKRVRV